MDLTFLALRRLFSLRHKTFVTTVSLRGNNIIDNKITEGHAGHLEFYLITNYHNKYFHVY